MVISIKLFKEVSISKWSGTFTLWQSFILSASFHIEIVPAGLEARIDRAASLLLEWGCKEGIWSSTHSTEAAVGGFCIHRKGCVWVRFWSGLISLPCWRKVVISCCSTAQGKPGGIYWEPKTLKPPEEKWKKIATTFIQQPNLHCLLFFDASCKTGNKSAQGQSIKGKKINCTRTIGEVNVASPLLLLHTNCLLIRELFALHGESTESQLLPQIQMQVPAQIFQWWEGISNKPAQSLPHHECQFGG